jgi:hypothetical protein
MYQQESKAPEHFLRKPRGNGQEDIEIRLAQYIYLINKVYTKPFLADQDFQIVYSEFFNLRGTLGTAGGDARREYFQYMREHVQNRELAYETVLTYLREQTSEVNVVFGSKLLSMVNPDEKPPWDGKVEGVIRPYLEKMGVEIPSDKKNTKKYKGKDDEYICAWGDFYGNLCRWYTGFIGKPEGKDWLEQFKKWFDKEWCKWCEKEFLPTKENKLSKTIKPVHQWFCDQSYSLPDDIDRIRECIKPVKVIDLILWQRGYFPFECSHK